MKIINKDEKKVLSNYIRNVRMMKFLRHYGTKEEARLFWQGHCDWVRGGGYIEGWREPLV